MAISIGRRQFISALGGAAAVWPLTARAQPPEQIRRIGVLMGTAESDPAQRALVSTFVQGLTDLGWQDGKNIRIEYRWASGDTNRLRSLAAELASLMPAIIFTQGTPATMAVQQASHAAPVVFVNVTDPVKNGLVASLAHPGGNITGFSNYEEAIGGKWLELLKEVAPNVTRVAVLFNADNAGLSGSVRALEAVAPTLGIKLTAVPARDATAIERAIDDFGNEPNGGLLVFADFLMMANRELIVKLAALHHLAALYSLSQFATSGGLMSYSIDSNDLFLRAASYVDRILRGAKPGDLPVQQPTKFELVINLKTAKALGLSIPQTLLATADQVIE